MTSHHRRSRPGTVLLLAALTAGCGARPGAAADPAPPVVAPASQAAIEGDVLGPAGEPIAGALVSASAHFDLDEPDPAHDARADARGHFRFTGLPPGRYGVTATCADQAAAYGGVVTVAPGGAPARLTLRVGGPDAAIEGTVRDERGAPLPGARVLAAAMSENEGDVYVAHTDAAGRYLLRLPTKTGYFLVADASPRPRANRSIEPVAQVVDLQVGALPAPRPADEAIAAWLRARATPLPTGRDLDAAGARAIGAIAGGAVLLAMGEATHGSAEFPAWRQRVFAALVRDHGFTVYAVETGFAEALALDEYVVHGSGDPRAAIRQLQTWKDETEETLALVQWMRAYNADPGHPDKLHFEGFDVLTPQAVIALVAYLGKVDPAAVAGAEKALSPFARIDADQTYPALPRPERDRVRGAVSTLVAQLDANRAAYAARSSEDAWARARQLARVIEQAVISFSDPRARDAQMVENIGWLVRHHRPGTKVLLDAHNAHIAAEGHGMSDMGRLLREGWGARYVAIGFAFGAGSFAALDWQKGPSNERRDLGVERAPRGTFDGDLALAGHPAFVVDLRGAGGPIEAWLRSPQRMHSIGGFFEGPDHAFQRYAPARAFDAVIYLDRVSPIHPLGPDGAR
jgi:erythromycin esterase